MKSKYSVASVLRLEDYSLASIAHNSWQYRTLKAISRCRTAAMGGHIDKCSCCKKLHISYNSCRNRHCPTCQGHKVQEWVNARTNELIPTRYFHVVFTLPSQLNSFCLQHPKEMYSILFKIAWHTLKVFAKNPKHLGANMGMIAVLHTWGQNLSLHPHLHCIVPGGGVTKHNKWKTAKNKGKYLFDVKAMSKVFRAKFVAETRKQNIPIPNEVYQSLFTKNWVVYAKQPFNSPKSIVEYLSRYTHKIAISNHRILNIDNKNKTVKFSVKDYKKGGKKTTLTLTTKEFIRRFCLHILPKGFTRLRHYGILSSSWKKEKLPALQKEMGVVFSDTVQQQPTILLNKCPSCKVGDLIPIVVFGNKGPPMQYKHLLHA